MEAYYCYNAGVMSTVEVGHGRLLRKEPAATVVTTGSECSVLRGARSAATSYRSCATRATEARSSEAEGLHPR